MNLYDNAHELAKSLKNSDEYRLFLQAKKLVDTDEQAKKMVKDFLAKQMELEMEMMTGKGQDKAKTAELQKMYELISLNTKARDFMQAHIKFQRVMSDVYKIIGDAVAEGMDFFGKK
ncbi:MAG: YlbF family regulator [Pelosinus sp.]|nr:YlbF family regulator [Pelosinus sp.]